MTGQEGVSRIRVPEVRRTDIDGIPAFSIDGPRPFTAVLEFRVGTYDEPLAKRGITHLVEHLAMFSHRESEITVNASVGPHLTSFWAQGHPDEVGRFMRDVAVAIHDLPYDRLDVEAKVLAHESAAYGHSNVDRLLHAYFGPFGPGVSVYGELGLARLRPVDITGWASRFFTRDNAAYVIIGRPPESWGVELPQGAPMRYSPIRHRIAPERPTLYETQEHGVTWGALVFSPKGVIQPELEIAEEVVAQRLRNRLRHDLGRTYSVLDGYRRLDEEYLVVFHGFDAHPSQSRVVAEEHLSVLSEFVEQGPTPVEIDRFIRVREKVIEDHPGSIARGLVTDLAEAHLQGWKGPVKYTEWLEACRVATPEAIRSRFAEAYRQSFLIADLPGDILDGLEGIILPKSEPLLGIEFRYRGRLRVPEKVDPDAEQLPAAIRVGPDGVSIRWREGWTNEPPTQIALIISENGWIRIEAAYTSLTFDARKYRRRRTGDRGFSGDRSKTIDEAMRKYLPPDLFLPSIREGMREQGVAHPKRHEPQPR